MIDLTKKKYHLLTFLLLLAIAWIIKPSKTNTHKKANTKEAQANTKEAQANLAQKPNSLLANETKNLKFSATPTHEFIRGESNMVAYPEAHRVERQYTEKKVFQESFFIPKQGKLNGSLTKTDLTKSAIEASLNLANVEEFLQSDAELINIPVSTHQEIPVKFNTITHQGEHTVTLSGKVNGHPLSEANFVFHDGAVAGSIELPNSNTYYEYGMAGNGDIAIRTLDTDKNIYGDCETCNFDVAKLTPHQRALLSDLDSPPESETPLNDPMEEILADEASSDFTYVIDLVLSYAGNAKDAVGGTAAIEAKILLGVSFIAVNMTNSDIPDTFVTLLGTVEEDAGYSAATGGIYDLRDGLLNANVLQDLLGADLSGYIYNGSGGLASTAGNGLTAGVNSMGSSSASFPHEFGHNMGLYHAWADTTGSSATSVTQRYFGWRFLTPSNSQVRTLMCYNNGWAGPRIGYFSSPDNYYETVKMGAEPGYDASEDPTVDPQLVNGGIIGTAGPGYDGSNPNLGADCRSIFMANRISRQTRSIRESHAVISPAGTGVYSPGDSLPINWIGGDQLDTVEITLIKSGAPVSTIEQNHLAIYRFQEWDLPNNLTSSNEYAVQITFSTGEVITSNTFSIEASLPFSAWMASYGLAIDTPSSSTGDGDGVSDLMEYVLNGDPTTDDSQEISPVLSLNSGNSTYRFTRRIESTEDTDQIVQYSNDLVSWTDIPVAEAVLATGVSVTPNADNQLEDVSVELGSSNEEDGRVFIRLKVEQE